MKQTNKIDGNGVDLFSFWAGYQSQGSTGIRFEGGEEEKEEKEEEEKEVTTANSEEQEVEEEVEEQKKKKKQQRRQETRWKTKGKKTAGSKQYLAQKNSRREA